VGVWEAGNLWQVVRQVAKWVSEAGKWVQVAGLSSSELFAPCSMVTQEGELQVACSTGWVVHCFWVGWCRVCCQVRAAGLQSVLLVGVLLCNILAIRDMLGGGKEVSGVSGGAGKGSGVADEGGGGVG